MCCVPSRSGSWSPSSVSSSAAAWCRSPPLAARPFRRSLRLSGSRVTAQKHWEHEHQGNSECALYLQLTYWTMESPTITASHPISWRGAKRLREEISKTRGGEGGGGGGGVIVHGLDCFFRCCTQGPWFPDAWVKDIWEDRCPRVHGACAEKHTELRCAYSPRTCGQSARDVSSVALRSLSWACFPSSLWICHSTASSCIECSSNASLPALKGRHKSAIKASNSETMVDVCK